MILEIIAICDLLPVIFFSRIIVIIAFHQGFGYFKLGFHEVYINYTNNQFSKNSV